MRNARGMQTAAQRFRILHAGRADQNGTARLVNRANLFLERAVPRLLVRIKDIGEVLANHRAVRRDHRYRQLVDFPEFFGLRGGGARHAADPFIHSGEALHRDGAENASLGLQRHAFFGLDGGLQTGRPAAVLRDAAFELVDQFHGAILDDVIDIAPEQRVRVQGVLDRGQNPKIVRRRTGCRSRGLLST